jgi:mRNA-degrading endonuclease YafQ of YafQ-DinJ toxin-antitoxin module
MQVTYHPHFKKQYKKLRPAQSKRFASTLALFVTQPNHPDLYNHTLTGAWKVHRSISWR